MRRISLFIGIILVAISSCFTLSCGKRSTTPVDEYVTILDEATEKAEKIASMQDLLNVKEIISPEAAMQIVRENSDYKLTKGDKEKLKKSYDRLLKVAYEKTAEYGGLPEEVRKQTKDQIQLFIDAANTGIDRAQTMGDLMGDR